MNSVIINNMKEKITITFLMLVVVLPILTGIGWVRNLVKFVKLDFQEPYKAEIIRGISITPIGAITGWIKIEDK